MMASRGAGCVVFLWVLLSITLTWVRGTQEQKLQEPCDVCRSLINNFHKNMEKTQNGTYNSGSRTWETTKLVPYNRSELRLMHILENICIGVDDEIQCIALLEKNEKAIEQWFFDLYPQNISLFDHFCINTTKDCCPQFHYGKDCSVCHGYVNGTLCSGYGTCVGDGTRKGNGSCTCLYGHEEPMCSSCKSNHYPRPNSTECFPCHYSCNGTCVNHTMEGCIGTCRNGWQVHTNGSCVDIDECALNLHNCTQDDYCLNVPGSFYCEKCHAHCLTCNGNHDTNCLVCRPGYEKDRFNRCIDVDECERGTHHCKPLTYCINKVGYYSCKACHKGCRTSCHGPKLQHCADCNDGYEPSDDGTGCQDINECIADATLCPNGKYCKNINGSYKCKKCDEACRLCHSAGPYSCLSCSDGYKMVNGVCKDSNKIDASEEEL